jgi:GNAT superfamily N-acetyltransferase
MNVRLRIRRGTVDDHGLVIGLIEGRADWIRAEKDTLQWDQPWPSLPDRNERVRKGLREGHTWIACNGARPVATVTIYQTGDTKLWTESDLKTEAVYIHRLVLDKDYAGNGLGAELINWAGRRGKRDNPSAQLIRVDVWSDNKELHAYYQRHGFIFVDTRETDDGCPSGTLFEKPIQEALDASTPRFIEVAPPTVWPIDVCS